MELECLASPSFTAKGVASHARRDWRRSFARLAVACLGWLVPLALHAQSDTGRVEPLRLLEVDDARGEAVLRSESPAKKGEHLAYYEVRLSGLDRATVRRFTASRAASGREQVAFALTHEVLAKLAGDIAG